VFTSLPKAGIVRAARLLVEIGDCRRRYPTPGSLTSPAGATPSTRQSGKVRIISFRWAVDKELRGAVTDSAGDFHHANAWAADLYAKARAHGCDHPHATRILARAWLHVIWRRALRERGITPRIARRGFAHGSGLGRVRWVVEQTFAWLHQLKRLRIRYEVRADLHSGLLQLACSLICHWELPTS